MALWARLERVGNGPERAGHPGTDGLFAQSPAGEAMLRRPIIGELLGHAAAGLVKSDDSGEIKHWILLFPSTCYRLSGDSKTLPPLTPVCQPVK